MKSSSKRLLGVTALLAVVLGVYILLRLPGPSDRDQILAQMESARAAAQNHNVSGIMKVISAEYKGSSPFDANVDTLHFFLSKVVGQGNSSALVSLSPPSIQVHGDTADSVSQVTVQGNGGSYNSPITLHWRREDGTRWLVFPAKVWRVVGSEYQAPSGGDEGGGLL